MTPDWMSQANCIGVDPDIMFPEGKGRHYGVEAKAVCAGCTVRDACLEYAFVNGERFGVWGGKTEAERRPLRRAWLRAQGVELNRFGRRIPQHGTRARYQRGCRCDECRAANARRGMRNSA